MSWENWNKFLNSLQPVPWLDELIYLVEAADQFTEWIRESIQWLF